MERRRFCVYNQTSECFLSLGVAVADSNLARFKGLIGRRELNNDEGLWVVPSKGSRRFNLGITVPLDLVYLNKDYQVIYIVESFCRSRIAPHRTDTASVLALPAHTIYSSQTQLGSQLVICEAEEMKFRLRSAPSLEFERRIEGSDLRLEDPSATTPGESVPQYLHDNRRWAPRQPWPRLVAYDWDGATVEVYGIRDGSANGLYLLTDKRWPLGALVMMTLQRTESSDDSSGPSITVQLRVMRWGPDGVGLAFVLPTTLEASPWLEPGDVTDDRDEYAIQDEKKEAVQ